LRQAGLVRRTGYGLGVVAVAVAAALATRYLWAGAHAGRESEWDKARMVLLVVLLVGLPWVSRRRGVFGPVGRSAAARVVRAGGCAALVALVLDIARIEHFPSPAGPGLFNPAAEAWSWAHEVVAVGLIAVCLAAVLIVPARWPRARPVLVTWCAVAAGLVLFFTVAPLQVLITVYAAGILAVTARQSPVTPATLAISAGTGVGGGLLMAVLWNPLHTGGPSHSQGSRAMLLFMLLALVAAAGIVIAGAPAARRNKDKADPVALKAEVRQYLAAGPLTAASAALVFTLLRVNPAIHVAAMCPVTKALHPGLRPFLCSSAPAIWMFYLVAGPLLGLAIAACVGTAVTAPPPPGLPPPKPPGEPPSDGSHWGGVFVKM
jgi:hypothetical protein